VGALGRSKSPEVLWILAGDKILLLSHQNKSLPLFVHLFFFNNQRGRVCCIVLHTHVEGMKIFLGLQKDTGTKTRNTYNPSAAWMVKRHENYLS
jgi:hypothetical protein